MAFVPCFLLCAGISFHAPALLIKAAWLLRVPLKSLPSLSDVLPLLNTLAFCCTDQRPARNSSKGIIQKKERGEEDQDIRDVALNKLDGYPILVERTSKGKGGATSTKLGESILILGIICILFHILLFDESGNAQQWHYGTEIYRLVVLHDIYRLVQKTLKQQQSLPFHSSSQRPTHVLSLLLLLSNHTGQFPSFPRLHNCPVKVEADWHWTRKAKLKPWLVNTVDDYPITFSQFCRVPVEFFFSIPYHYRDQKLSKACPEKHP